MMRETKMAVNMLMMMPRTRVTAKPRIGPVPNWYRMMATMTFVVLESRMVKVAFP